MGAWNKGLEYKYSRVRCMKVTDVFMHCCSMPCWEVVCPRQQVYAVHLYLMPLLCALAAPGAFMRGGPPGIDTSVLAGVLGNLAGK
jgi:hypothetical protein